MFNERSIVTYTIFKYGCSQIFIERKCYITYIWNFSKVRSTNRVDDDEILEVAKRIH